MKTEQLIALLAADTAPLPRRAVVLQLALPWAAGLTLSAGLMAVQLGLRPDLAQSAAAPVLWLKLLFAAATAGGAFALLSRLARPGMAVGAMPLALAAPLLGLWAAALFAVTAAPAAERAVLLWGRSWSACLVNIGLLSLPVLAAAMWGLHRQAPTRPVLAGASAGILAGASAAAVYALHCPESALPFIAVWYVAGMALPAVLGAALGPRLLRW